MLTVLAATLLIQSFWAQNAQTGTPVTECTADERVLIDTADGVFPATVLRAHDADRCVVTIDEYPTSGALAVGLSKLLRGTNPPAPSAEAARLGALETLSQADQIRLRSLAMETHADARIYFSRFSLTSHDDLIVTRICNRDWTSPICKRANGQFHGSYNQAMEAVDLRNARTEAEDRATRAASEPINSGYYTSGQYSREVAASQAGSSTPSRAPASAPIAVQSETAIREAQARCRAGSGPC